MLQLSTGWIGKVGWEVLLNKAGTTFKKLDDATEGRARRGERPRR